LKNINKNLNKKILIIILIVKNKDTNILSTYEKIILSIKKYINDDLILKNKFNHYNNKYELDEVLKYILDIFIINI